MLNLFTPLTHRLIDIIEFRNVIFVARLQIVQVTFIRPTSANSWMQLNFPLMVKMDLRQFAVTPKQFNQESYFFVNEHKIMPWQNFNILNVI